MKSPEVTQNKIRVYSKDVMKVNAVKYEKIVNFFDLTSENYYYEKNNNFVIYTFKKNIIESIIKIYKEKFGNILIKEN